MSKLMLRTFLVLSLLGFAGCATSDQQSSEGEESPGPPGGVTEAGRIELPEPEPMPITSNPNRPVPPSPPPTWLVVGGEAVQASYGRTCEEGACNGREPQQLASELATAEVPAHEKVYVVIGSNENVELEAGVVGWEDLPEGPTPRVTFTESGDPSESAVPFFMRSLGAQPLPEEERPAVELAPGGEEEHPPDFAVFELASMGNPGDRLLSIYTHPPGESPRFGQKDQATYHWRLNPGEEGENLPPPEEGLPRVVELERGPETVEYSPEEVAEQATFREVKKTSFDRSGGIEAGEGYLWVLDPKERSQGRADNPKGGKTEGKAGPPPATTLLKVDPDTREVLYTIAEPGFRPVLEVGAGAVWLAGSKEESVVRLDPETEIAQVIDIGGGPNGIVATEDGVWVSVYDDTQSGRVVRIDPETNEVVAEIETPGIAESIAVDAETGDVWTVSLDQTQGAIEAESSQLVRIDPATNEITERFKVEGGVSGVAAAEGGTVWISTGVGREQAMARKSAEQRDRKRRHP